SASPPSIASVALSGTGVAGRIDIKPGSLSFGKVAVDTISTAKTVTVTNPNSVALSITSIAASGSFAVTANTCDSAVAAKSPCTISVTFNPTTDTKIKGTRETGILSITDDALKSPQEVKLSGEAFGTPVATATATATATTTISPTPTATATATATATGTPSPSATVTATA